MVVGFNFVVCILALIMLGSFLFRSKKVDSLFIMFSIMVGVNCFGRYMLSVSENLDVALWANKFLYVGGCFAPLLTVFVLARLCGNEIPKPIKAFLIGYATLIMGLVFTIGKTDIYYKTVELGHTNGYSYLIKSYGPLHILYPIMLLLYAVVMVVYLVYAIKKRTQLSFRLVLTLCVCCFAIIFMYIFERIIGSNISFLSVGYLFGIALLINYFERVNIYDMSTNIISAVEKMNEYGYVVFDDKCRYISANDYLKKLYPEINHLKVDCEVPEEDNAFYNEVIQFLYQCYKEGSGKKTITVQGRYYEMELRMIGYGKKPCVGYLIEFIDRTMEMQYSVSLEREVERQTEHIVHIKDMMVLGMADMVESRDTYTGGHIKRTSAVVKTFSEKLEQYCGEFGFDEAFLKCVAKAAPMHDLGKIAIDDKILRKPGKYTDEEFAIMKTHAAQGAKTVENILRGVEDDDFVKIAENVAHYHHEKWNGYGYPGGLKGEEIPIEARIMALADVFDALVTKRCYKEAFTYDKAFKIIEESLGQHFDPKLGKIFMSCRPELEDLYNIFLEK